MKQKVNRTRAFKRPCQECMGFQRIGGRFGVCEMGEHPSDPTVCKSFKKRR